MAFLCPMLDAQGMGASLWCFGSLSLSPQVTTGLGLHDESKGTLSFHHEERSFQRRKVGLSFPKQSMGLV